MRSIKPPQGKNGSLKINYGCGLTSQPGYLNVDIRWTPVVDVMGDLSWCARTYRGKADEVYCSHVLEHYDYPGREWRSGPGTVTAAMADAYAILKPGGCFRIAVPDFGVIASLYTSGAQPFYPLLSGRICGEQNYRENRHHCAFDKAFLEKCLLWAGFENISPWDTASSGLIPDSSFDQVGSVQTSLNLLAWKPSRSG
jgi:predicted SAM-dependent methyltransferase